MKQKKIRFVYWFNNKDYGYSYNFISNSLFKKICDIIDSNIIFGIELALSNSMYFNVIDIQVK